MIYEAKVNDLADEFGVHRNTIRNWINSGVLPAQEGPGRRYLIQWEDYKRLCDKYGREPRMSPDPGTGSEIIAPRSNGNVPIPVRLEAKSNPLYSAPLLADVCLTCGSCAGACPISGVDDLDPRRYGVIVSAHDGRRGLLLPDLEGVDTVSEQVGIAARKGGIDLTRDAYTLERFTVTRHA